MFSFCFSSPYSLNPPTDHTNFLLTVTFFNWRLIYRLTQIWNTRYFDEMFHANFSIGSTIQINEK